MSGLFLLNHAFLIPLAPPAAFVVILAFRNKLGLQGAWVGIPVMLYALGHALLIAAGLFSGSLVLPKDGLQGKYFEWAVNWFSVGNFDFRVGVLIDGLSSLMLVVVTLVSLLVQVYSIAYMREHKRFGRYFAYVNLFTFSMLLLVVANDMLQFFIGWELVGLSSYLLIGFDFEKETAAVAARKAFLTTRLGDLGFYLALLTIFNYLGTFNIPQLFQNITAVPYPSWVLTAVPLLLFCGAMGKSAQVPLHAWLPDAMEGPTPASALIHAATMVAAGVFLVARVYFLFQASPIALDVVAWIGVLTALMGAIMGVVSNDIKRVLAFSTVSQLGFMMTALGCGGYSAGMFHLATHAAFKALLFLCAGSVIHAVHTNDMWKMGGLKTQMPVTAASYLVATLAITGCPPFAGFYSKEEVLGAALHHNPVIFALLAVAATLTSFYMFRSWFLTFTGMPRDRERFQHAHESPALMTGPLIILAFLAASLGFFFWYQGNLEKFVHWGTPETHGGGDLVMFTSLSAFTVGLAGACTLYLGGAPKTHPAPAGEVVARLYRDLLDLGPVAFVTKSGQLISKLGSLFDGRIIDRVFVDGPAVFLSRVGESLRRVQSGFAQSYLFWMIVGLGSMLAWVAHKFH